MAWNGYSEQGQGSEERGPSTFTYNPQAATQQEVSLGTQRAQAGMGGGGTQGGIAQYNEFNNATQALTTLMGLAADKLAPVANKMKEKAFLSGMAKAASGEEMATIINERPWFTRIFGDTPVVEGARAYKAKEATSQFQAISMERMEELRKRPPEAMADYVQGQFEAFATTGDAETDTLIKNSIAQITPDLVKLHTREHVKYMQEMASDNQLKAWGSTAASLQSQFAPGLEFTKEMLDDAKAAYGASLAPPPGADEESWKKNLLKHIELSAMAGNFHAIRAIEDMGAFAHMKAEDRAKLEPFIKKYEMQYAATDGIASIQQEYLKARHDVQMGRVTPEELMVWMGRKSDEWRAKSGSSQGLFALPEQNQMVRSAQTARAQVLAAEYKAWEKANAEGVNVEYAMSRLGVSNPYYIADTSRGLVKKEEMDDISRDAFLAADYQGRLSYMRAWAQEDGYSVPKSIKADLARTINMSNPDHITPNFMQVAATFKDLDESVGGKATVGAWFDSKDSNFLRAFVKYGGLTGEARDATKAFEFAKRTSELSGIRTLKEADAKQVSKFVTDKTVRGGFYFNWTKEQANPATTQLLNTLMAEEVGKLDSTLSGAPMHEEAWRRVTQRVQPLGKYAYTVDPTREFENLDTILTKKAGGTVALNTDSVGEAADRLLKDRLKLVGGSTSSQIHLVREADRDGVAHFTALEFSDDTPPRFVTFTSDNLLEYINTVKTEKLDKIKRRATNLRVEDTAGGAALVHRKRNR